VLVAGHALTQHVAWDGLPIEAAARNSSREDAKYQQSTVSAFCTITAGATLLGVQLQDQLLVCLPA
jgi:hypothetical protein